MMNFTAEFPNLKPEEKFPSAYDFLVERASRIIGSGDHLLDKEVDQLTDSEKWAICFYAKVPMRLEKGDSPNHVKMVTDCEVEIQRIDGKFKVLIRESTPR